ncbi:hypothetical protein KVT40_004507 [Elsinoe batatas]|uniref:Uncharacterized protein n=1 Tax=Elsinoe batatas TaxID=2601811 RepID=A0A8K0L241_9PEZI|nr:hypothetical protein KVT40_004507 [Elsinoe batatas]
MSTPHIINTVIPRNILLQPIPQAPKQSSSASTKNNLNKIRSIFSMNKAGSKRDCSAAAMAPKPDNASTRPASIASSSTSSSTKSSTMLDKVAAQRDWAAASQAASPSQTKNSSSTTKKWKSSVLDTIAAKRDYWATSSAMR